MCLALGKTKSCKTLEFAVFRSDHFALGLPAGVLHITVEYLNMALPVDSFDQGRRRISEHGCSLNIKKLFVEGSFPLGAIETEKEFWMRFGPAVDIGRVVV